MALRFLVVDGNDVAGRARQHERLGRTAGIGYSGVLHHLAPGSETAVVTPADEDADLPSRDQLIARFDAVVLTGSALHVWEEQPSVLRQVAFARRVFESGLPFFGSCWGLQIATVAAGGVVEKNPRGREVGIARHILLNEAGMAHPMLESRPRTFDAPCIHLDAVTKAAPGTTILASNAMSDVQAAEISFNGGVFWGVQYHPEFTLTHLARILTSSMQIHIDEGKFRDEAEAAAYCADLTRLCENPDLTHLAWRYGICPELLHRERRLTEIRNFIGHRVRPYAETRAAA
jgi:GMP synthase (glutamine-hydrolysing)